MIITIPKSVKVGGKRYKVHCPYKFTERDDIYGQIDHQALEIKIATRSSNEKQRSPEEITVTFLHETLHAIDLVYGAGCGRRDVSTEHIICQLAEGLFQVLGDWLKEYEKGRNA